MTNIGAPVVSETVSERVYRIIKNAIIEGTLKPGERIVQENLTQQLNVSRTPVRDALQRLSSEGLVVLTAFHGAEVFELSKKSLEELYEIRIVLENFAAQKALEHIGEEEIKQLEDLNQSFIGSNGDIQKCMQYDRAFHDHLCKAAQLSYINDILQGIWNKCDPYKSLYFRQPKNIERTIFEHDQILKAMRSKQKTKLFDAIQEHLSDVVEDISSNLNITE